MVVMFGVKPTIEVARFPRKGVVRPDPSGRGGTNGIYKVTQLLPTAKAMTTSTGLKMPMNRTSGSSKKASWIALGDRRTAPLD